jgi:hypothetical protein
MMADIAQSTSCKVYGIEFITNKIFLAMQSAVSAIKSGELINCNIGYIPWDLTLLESLGPATIAIFNDEAFSSELVEHICKTLVKPRRH